LTALFALIVKVSCPRGLTGAGFEILVRAANAGQYLGIREVVDEKWLVSFMDYEPAFFDLTENRVEPVGGLTPSLQKCYPCPRNKVQPMCPEYTDH
jgi:hypothetical protein